jgi:hypothetical protein
MDSKEDNYQEYSATKTYSLKIKNIKKVDDVAKQKQVNKSQALNVIIEEY